MALLTSTRSLIRMIAAAAVVTVALTGCHTVFDGELSSIACLDEGAQGPPGCPVGQRCLSGLCNDLGGGLGVACTADSDCESAFCLDPSRVGQSGAARCSQPCCASTDCGDPSLGQVCWTPGGGAGSVCWPASELEIEQKRGDKGASEPCAPGECRSGRCIEGTCLDTCCDDSYCGDDDICRVRMTELQEDEDTWTCATAVTQGDYGSCSTDGDCRTGTCVDLGEGLLICARPCCGSVECGTQFVEGVEHQLACQPLPGKALAACSKLLELESDGALGSPCGADQECRSGICAPGGYCTDLCCDDASCGDTAQFACRPVQASGGWALQCERK